MVLALGVEVGSGGSAAVRVVAELAVSISFPFLEPYSVEAGYRGGAFASASRQPLEGVRGGLRDLLDVEAALGVGVEGLDLIHQQRERASRLFESRLGPPQTWAGDVGASPGCPAVSLWNSPRAAITASPHPACRQIQRTQSTAFHRLPTFVAGASRRSFPPLFNHHVYRLARIDRGVDGETYVAGDGDGSALLGLLESDDTVDLGVTLENSDSLYKLAPPTCSADVSESRSDASIMQQHDLRPTT